jgi:hypothetical protein
MSDHDEWMSYSQGACLLWSASSQGSRIDLATQFALRLQLSANTRHTGGYACAP